MTKRKKVLVALYVVAFVGLIVGFAYKYRNDSMAACVTECVAKCGR